MTSTERLVRVEWAVLEGQRPWSLGKNAPARPRQKDLGPRLPSDHRRGCQWLWPRPPRHRVRLRGTGPSRIPASARAECNATSSGIGVGAFFQCLVPQLMTCPPAGLCRPTFASPLRLSQRVDIHPVISQVLDGFNPAAFVIDVVWEVVDQDIAVTPQRGPWLDASVRPRGCAVEPSALAGGDPQTLDGQPRGSVRVVMRATEVYSPLRSLRILARASRYSSPSLIEGWRGNDQRPERRRSRPLVRHQAAGLPRPRT